MVEFFVTPFRDSGCVLRKNQWFDAAPNFRPAVVGPKQTPTVTIKFKMKKSST